MILTRRNRRLLRPYLRPFLILFTLFFLIDSLFLTHPSNPPDSTAPPNERLFIASIHWNNAPVLRSHWNNAILSLVNHFGVNNTYVSVIESGSWDDSADALLELDQELKVIGARRMVKVNEGGTHEQLIQAGPQTMGEEGWIHTSRSGEEKKDLRRVPYLANLRNGVMDEMERLRKEEGIVFDKVLWINDVVFNLQDILTLLSTNAGHYAAACSLDFSRPPLYYDTFALRDFTGRKPISQTWPYFLSRTSRSALKSQKPVPVQSCWNGIVSMDATPFYSSSSASSETSTEPLKFRGIPDSLSEQEHLEGSECCLIHLDNPISLQKPIFLNPLVRVGYHAEAYDDVHPGLDSPFAGRALWPSAGERVRGMWYLRLIRLLGWPGRVTERMDVQSKIGEWKKRMDKEGMDQDEKAGVCVVNEQHVLAGNGWAHV